MNMRQRLSQLQQRITYLNERDVTPLIGIMHNRFVRLFGFITLLVIACIPAIGAVLLMIGLMVGTFQVLSYGVKTSDLFQWLWVFVQSVAIDGLLPSALVFALITKGLWGRIPHSAVAVLIALTSIYILHVLYVEHTTGMPQAQVLASDGVAIEWFTWARSFLVILAVCVDTVYVALAYNKVKETMITGQVGEAFSSWVASIFEGWRKLRNVRVQKQLAQTAYIEHPKGVQFERATSVQSEQKLNGAGVQTERSISQRSKGVQQASKASAAEKIERAFERGGYVSVRNLAQRSKCSIGSVHSWMTEHHPEQLNR